MRGELERAPIYRFDFVNLIKYNCSFLVIKKVCNSESYWLSLILTFNRRSPNLDNLTIPFRLKTLKKPNKIIEELLHKKREQKRIRRLHLNKKYNGYNSVVEKVNASARAADQRIWESFHIPLLDFFVKRGFIDGTEKISTKVIIPHTFNFTKDYNQAIKTIRNFVASISPVNGKEITVDFTNCKDVDQSALFILQIIGLDFKDEYQKLDKRLKILSGMVTFKVTPSNDEHVNKLLFVTGILQTVNLQAKGLLPLTTIGYLKGNKNQKHYSENRKGQICTRIVQYMNNCLSQHGYAFNSYGINYLDGMISEILNNSEDHSSFSTYYATGNLLSDALVVGNEDSVVGEMNFFFLNFGGSIFDGLEENKEENFENYKQLDALYEQVNENLPVKPFLKEHLFTLYALQPGISRLKFEEESRGNGTMKFITSFFAIGDYEDQQRQYNPALTIFSGGTQLTCDNVYKPFEKNNNYYISLNKENDLAKLPDKKNLKQISKPFPGTLLTAKIYLNKEHLTKKINAATDH